MTVELTCIAPYVPHEKITHAGGRFLGAYLESLCRVLSVTLIAPGDADNIDTLARSRPSYPVHLVPLPSRRRNPLSRALDGYPAVPGGLTPGAHIMRGFRADSDFHAVLRASDVVEIQWDHLLPLVPLIRRVRPDIKVTAVMHDVITQSFERQAKSGLRWGSRIVARGRLPLLRRQEVRLLNACDRVFAFSQKDLNFVRRIGVTTSSAIFSPHISRPPRSFRLDAESQRVLFVGAMSLPANWESAVWFIERVWPAVTSSDPGATLVIAGADPPEVLVEAASAAHNVVVTGWVDDLNEEYAKAAVFVAPLRTGAGVKFKILDAMVRGLPVVTTPIGAEGIEDGPYAAVTDCSSAQAEMISDLLRFPPKRNEFGRLGEAWVREHFSNETTLLAALDCYDSTTT